MVYTCNVQENAVFIHEYSKISLPWEGETKKNLPPLSRFAPSLWHPIDNSWLHHRHWHNYIRAQEAMTPPPLIGVK